MLSYNGNCPGMACGVHMHGGNGFTVTQWSSEPSESLSKAAEKLKGCSSPGKHGLHANGCLAFGENLFGQQSQTQLSEVLDHRNIRGRKKNKKIFLKWLFHFLRHCLRD